MCWCRGREATVNIAARIQLAAAHLVTMRASRSKSTAYIIVGSLCVTQLVLAMILARQSCDWSLSAYVVSGLMILGTILMVPYLMRRAFARHSRTPTALLFAMLGLVTWLIGLGINFSSTGCSNL